MTEAQRLAVKIVSHLLLYPDERWRAGLGSLHEVILELPPGPAREALADFVGQVRSRELLRWQEEYSRTFDLNPNTCLDLTYHKFGDGKGRGLALAQLREVYRRAGYEIAPGELPDYLPLVLEFLAIGPGDDGARLLREYRPQVEALARRLHEADTPYARLFSVILDTFPDESSSGGREPCTLNLTGI